MHMCRWRARIAVEGQLANVGNHIGIDLNRRSHRLRKFRQNLCAEKIVPESARPQHGEQNNQD